MIPGKVLKNDIIKNGIALKVAAERLNIKITELESIFQDNLDEEYFYQLCDKIKLLHIVPYGISLKVLEAYNELIKLAERVDKNNIELSSALLKLQLENKNLIYQLNCNNEVIKKQNEIIQDKINEIILLEKQLKKY